MIKQEEREFVIKPYPKEKLATMYHPQLCPKAAVGKMRRWINLNPELKRKMEEARVCAQTDRKSVV